MTIDLTRRAACAALLAWFAHAGAQAHGYTAGDVHIGHPYATPSVPGARNGAAYIASLEAQKADRLLRVSTPVAERAELHTMSVDAGGVMRMREVGDLPLTPGTPIKMRPGEGPHFMLMGLKQPLKEGDSFPMTLEFERGGKVEVKVVVQVPKGDAAGTAEHKH
ncbi:MAG TPA: copper chaperone PCu(A)C [Burkholderiaceae bacterium]|nr:copper chaperone PCu(A)C [Burkholderiaceae bacterium]